MSERSTRCKLRQTTPRSTAASAQMPASADRLDMDRSGWFDANDGSGDPGRFPQMKDIRLLHDAVLPSVSIASQVRAGNLLEFRHVRRVLLRAWMWT